MSAGAQVPGTLDCPADGCMREIGPFPPLCREHWHQVPIGIRDRIYQLWRRSGQTGHLNHQYYAQVRLAVGAVARLKRGRKSAPSIVDSTAARIYVRLHAEYRRDEWCFVRTGAGGGLLLAWRVRDFRGADRRPCVLHQVTVTRTSGGRLTDVDVYQVGRGVPGELREVRRRLLRGGAVLRIHYRPVGEVPAGASVLSTRSMEASA